MFPQEFSTLLTLLHYFLAIEKHAKKFHNLVFSSQTLRRTFEIDYVKLNIPSKFFDMFFWKDKS